MMLSQQDMDTAAKLFRGIENSAKRASEVQRAYKAIVNGINETAGPEGQDPVCIMEAIARALAQITAGMETPVAASMISYVASRATKLAPEFAIAGRAAKQEPRKDN